MGKFSEWMIAYAKEGIVYVFVQLKQEDPDQDIGETMPSEEDTPKADPHPDIPATGYLSELEEAFLKDPDEQKGQGLRRNGRDWIRVPRS